jgi:hypothetical protein
MKVLISPMETVVNPNTQEALGVRVCDIVETPFEVAQPLFWLDCPNGILGNTHCYNVDSETFVEIPVYVPIQPVSTGTQEL